MRGLVRWLAPATAALVVLAAGALLAQNLVGKGVGTPSGWVGPSAGVLWLVGLGLVVAAALASTLGEDADPALLAVVAVAWVAPVFAAWLGGPGALVASAAGFAVLALPALWQLLLRRTALRSVQRSVAIGAVWVVTAAAAVALTLVRDPFLDPRCTGTCVPNPLLIVPVPPLVSAAHIALDLLCVLVAAAGVGWVIRCLVRGIRRPALAAAPAVIVAGSAGFATLGAGFDAATLARTWLLAMALALAVLATASIIGALGEIRRAGLLRALAADLALDAGAQLRGRLAAALGERRLEVLYPLDSQRWVDAEGRDHAPPDLGGAFEFQREGETIAVVVGGGDRVAALATIGPAAGLAIDNERLRAGIAAHLNDLRASRIGVVEAADDERRRIERNLHDGMQQSLLVLQYELGIAASRADEAADRARLTALRDETHAITERLREIAHGVFPAALDDLGVEAALQRLIDDAPFPLEVSGAADPRPPRPIERTVYLVADEALTAGVSGPGTLTIALERAADAMTVRTGNASRTVSSALHDRVEALGGRVAALEDGIEVELPCASS